MVFTDILFNFIKKYTKKIIFIIKEKPKKKKKLPQNLNKNIQKIQTFLKGFLENPFEKVINIE